MVELNLKHVLILAVAVFLLYHFVGRCNCFNGNGASGNSFSVGGETPHERWIAHDSCISKLINLCSDTEGGGKGELCKKCTNKNKTILNACGCKEQDYLDYCGPCARLSFADEPICYTNNSYCTIPWQWDDTNGTPNKYNGGFSGGAGAGWSEYSENIKNIERKLIENGFNNTLIGCNAVCGEIAGGRILPCDKGDICFKGHCWSKSSLNS